MLSVLRLRGQSAKKRRSVPGGEVAEGEVADGEMAGGKVTGQIHAPVHA